MPLTEPTKLVLRRTALTGWAMTIDTTKRAAPDNDYFTILTTGAVNYNVDWGDGTSESNVTSNSKVHTYATPGVYSVKIFANTGSTFRPYYNNTAEGDKIITLEDSFLSFPFGTSLSRAFYGSTNLVSVSQYLDVSGVSDFSYTWHDCTSLTSFPLLDTSSGTNFYAAWNNCTSLTSFPLLDTSSGTNFTAAWDTCSGLTSFPLLNTSSGTGFTAAWRRCTSLTGFPLLDTSSGTTFYFAWYNCSGLTTFPLLDTSSGTNFANAWYGCSGLTTFPLLNTSSGTNFSEAWRSCTSLTSFPLINTSSGTNFASAWNGCSGLTSFPANFFDSWTATPANNCFVNAWDGCSSLTATSVENILNSIDTSGRSAPASGVDITIDYNGSSGTPNVSTAVTNLKSRGWTITLNGVAQ